MNTSVFDKLDLDLLFLSQNEDDMGMPERKSLIRSIKLTILLNEIEIKLNTNRFNFKDNRKVYEELIHEVSKVGILCGSMSLYVHGLIDRPPGDIDVLVDRESEIAKEFIERNKSSIEKHNKESSFNNVVESFDPVVQFKKYDILIDMFHDTNVKYVEYNGMKVQCPFQVIQKKIDIYSVVPRRKDCNDLKLILKRLNELSTTSWIDF